MTPVEFRGGLWHQKTRVPGVSCVCCLRDPTFCRFSRTPACDRRTQTQTDTDGHRPMVSSADAEHRAVKTKLFGVRTSRFIYTGVLGLLSHRWTGISWKYTHSVLPQRVRQECTYVLANDAAACMMRVHNRQRRLHNRRSSTCVVTDDNAS